MLIKRLGVILEYSSASSKTNVWYGMVANMLRITNSHVSAKLIANFHINNFLIWQPQEILNFNYLRYAQRPVGHPR